MKSQDIHIRPLEMKDAKALLDLRIENRTFFEAFEPVRGDDFYTLEAQAVDISRGIEGQAKDQDYSFGVFLNDSRELAGRVRLSAISRGPWQNANVGYFMSRRFNGRGYATEAVRLAAAYAFEVLELHRIQAAVMPWNAASLRVMEKAGFRKEGLALRYLKINGKWEDHVLFAVTREDFDEWTR